MINKLISSKAVIAKIIADLDLQEDNMRISDMIEWIGESVSKIGSVNQLVHKVSGIDGAPILQLVVAKLTNLVKYYISCIQLIAVDTDRSCLSLFILDFNFEFPGLVSLAKESLKVTKSNNLSL